MSMAGCDWVTGWTGDTPDDSSLDFGAGDRNRPFEISLKTLLIGQMRRELRTNGYWRLEMTELLSTYEVCCCERRSTGDDVV